MTSPAGVVGGLNGSPQAQVQARPMSPSASSSRSDLSGPLLRCASFRTSSIDREEPQASGDWRQSGKHTLPEDVKENYFAVGAVRLDDAVRNGMFEQENSPTHSHDYSKIALYRSTNGGTPRKELFDLSQAGWIKTTSQRNLTYPDWYSVRVFILPEDTGRRSYAIDMTSRLRRALKFVMSCIDISQEAWDGQFDPAAKTINPFRNLDDEDESLFYMFNTLKSPSPKIDRVSDVHAREAFLDVMDGDVNGLLTRLYPYQRRAAALMIERETAPPRMADPRFRAWTDQNGQVYYYNREEEVIVREKVEYEQSRGGILAETMGYGKTLICLAVVLATRGHVSCVPDGELLMTPEPPAQTNSLMRMAATKVNERSVPWKMFFQTQRQNGLYFEKCEKLLHETVGRYQIAEYSTRTLSMRNPSKKIERIIRLCCTTLIIVPPNLLMQWQNEISKHVRAGTLDMLVIDQPSQNIPPVGKLQEFDVVLMSKARFEKEGRDADVLFGIATIKSPLMELLWVRVIVDEGHGFAGAGQRTNAMAMRKFPLSFQTCICEAGAPPMSQFPDYPQSIFFVSETLAFQTRANNFPQWTECILKEVSLAANETPGERATVYINPKNDHMSALKARQKGDALSEECKDLDKLKLMVVNFLKLRPWANPAGGDRADWSKYMKPTIQTDGTYRKSAYLRSLLQGLIIRHTIDDISLDLTLPRLHNKVVRLEPSFYDKLSINLFLVVLTSNAITSERADEDYMFHPKNRHQLDVLISNLRQSGFWWVGFKKADVSETVRVSEKYLEENTPKATVTSADRELMSGAISAAKAALSTPCWQAFSMLHEVGVYIQDFPSGNEGELSRSWALDGQSANPITVGIVQARLAQQHVDDHLGDPEPTEGLAGAGLRAMQSARKRAAQEDESIAKAEAKTGLSEEPKLASPKKSTAVPKATKGTPPGLAIGSRLAAARVVGFTSAKLTYLIDRVLEYQDTEKIVIFYEGNNVAFWIAEALELINAKFLIYSNTLTVARRGTYLETFNQKEEFRILLMDLKQAAHGLHVACASRVYIVNPLWQPSIESQAIKRAHRIGQTKPVYVETLVLKDTLEDKMLRRRQQMTNKELQNAEKSLVDDQTMKEIIQRETFLTLDQEQNDQGHVLTLLQNAQQLFGRGRHSAKPVNPDDGLILGAGDSTKNAKGKRKAGEGSRAEENPSTSRESSKKQLKTSSSFRKGRVCKQTPGWSETSDQAMGVEPEALHITSSNDAPFTNTNPILASNFSGAKVMNRAKVMNLAKDDAMGLVRETGETLERDQNLRMKLDFLTDSPIPTQAHHRALIPSTGNMVNGLS